MNYSLPFWQMALEVAAAETAATKEMRSLLNDSNQNVKSEDKCRKYSDTHIHTHANVIYNRHIY